MAHNLNINNGKVSFFTVKEKAWHGLGKVLNNNPSSELAIKMAGLDFEVGISPVYAQLNELTKHETLSKSEVLKIKNSKFFNTNKVPKAYATYRTDNNKVFGIVGDRYTPIQNKEMFEFIDSIVGEGECVYETAGALGNGEIVFVTAKLPSYIKVKGDNIEKYLLFTMAHDGTGSIQILFTPIRVVCNNTLTAALQQKQNKVTIKHTKNAQERIKKATEVLGISNSLFTELDEIFNKMAETEISDDQFDEYISNIIVPGKPLELLSSIELRKLSEISDFREQGVGQDLISCKNTVFGAFNAITGWLQNYKTYNSEEIKFKKQFLGTNLSLTQKSFDLAKELITI